MTGVVGHKGSRGVELVVGVDTHQDEHVAVAIDRQGVRLGELHTVATTHGYEELERWSRGLGEIHAFGIEGTGSYGAGVARFLTSRGHTVVEVNRPDRSTRYRKGKSDPTDAEMAARAVLAGVADATPKSGEGEVEMIRMFKSTKDSAVKARTQAINQMKALVVTAPTGDSGPTATPQSMANDAEGGPEADGNGTSVSFPSVSAGGDHTCGVKTDSSVACWGSNAYGKSTPPAGSFTSVSVGQDHTCGVKTGGSVVCWGFSSYQVTSPAGSFASVSAGYQTSIFSLLNPDLTARAIPCHSVEHNSGVEILPVTTTGLKRMEYWTH